jgi:hypothetical protein
MQNISVAVVYYFPDYVVFFACEAPLVLFRVMMPLFPLLLGAASGTGCVPRLFSFAPTTDPPFIVTEDGCFLENHERREITKPMGVKISIKTTNQFSTHTTSPQSCRLNTIPNNTNNPLQIASTLS